MNVIGAAVGRAQRWALFEPRRVAGRSSSVSAPEPDQNQQSVAVSPLAADEGLGAERGQYEWSAKHRRWMLLKAALAIGVGAFLSYSIAESAKLVSFGFAAGYVYYGVSLVRQWLNGPIKITVFERGFKLIGRSTTTTLRADEILGVQTDEVPFTRSQLLRVKLLNGKQLKIPASAIVKHTDLVGNLRTLENVERQALPPAKESG